MKAEMIALTLLFSLLSTFGIAKSNYRFEDYCEKYDQLTPNVQKTVKVILNSLRVGEYNCGKALQRARRLTYLDVRFQDLTEFEPISTLTGLEILLASDNQFTTLDGIYRLSMLRELDLARNGLDYLSSKDFLFLERLQTIDLRDNFLQNAEPLIKLRDQHQLQSIRISQNPCWENDRCGLSSQPRDPQGRLLPGVLIVKGMELYNEEKSRFGYIDIQESGTGKFTVGSEQLSFKVESYFPGTGFTAELYDRSGNVRGDVSGVLDNNLPTITVNLDQGLSYSNADGRIGGKVLKWDIYGPHHSTASGDVRLFWFDRETKRGEITIGTNDPRKLEMVNCSQNSLEKIACTAILINGAEKRDGRLQFEITQNLTRINGRVKIGSYDRSFVLIKELKRR